MQLLMHTTDMAKQKDVISIQISVTPTAKEAVDRITARTEIPQKRVLSRIFEWFARLPGPAQKSILWPDETGPELEAMRVALEYLDRRREALNSGRATDQQEEGKQHADLRTLASTKLRAIEGGTPTETPTTPSRPDRHRASPKSATQPK